ncbi:hypothetical protein RRG08_037935 [Elysia crispata]|uniref:Uncharacterized protein n=1 Tax=Elysia crispata TaxID=231223 RepID=A0AAE1DA28_9GAST|nr:hypothetical protein RRG08_037935 [Elysia crispata]
MLVPVPLKPGKAEKLYFPSLPSVATPTIYSGSDVSGFRSNKGRKKWTVKSVIVTGFSSFTHLTKVVKHDLFGLTIPPFHPTHDAIVHRKETREHHVQDNVMLWEIPKKQKKGV